MNEQKPNRLMDIDVLTPEQVQAALQRLEAEKRKRFEARVAAGEIAVVSVMVLHDQDQEAAKAAAIARHLADNPQDKSKELVLELIVINTGVPRSDEE
jgi:glutaminase